MRRDIDHAAPLQIGQHPVEGLLGLPTEARGIVLFAHGSVSGRFSPRNNFAARAIVAKLRAITPLVVPSDVAFRNPEDRELFLSGLRMAAGEAK